MKESDKKRIAEFRADIKEHRQRIMKLKNYITEVQSLCEHEDAELRGTFGYQVCPDCGKYRAPHDSGWHL